MSPDMLQDRERAALPEAVRKALESPPVDVLDVSLLGVRIRCKKAVADQHLVPPRHMSSGDVLLTGKGEDGKGQRIVVAKCDREALASYLGLPPLEGA